MAQLNVQPGDVWLRRGSRQHSPYILIGSVENGYAYPVPVIRGRSGGWARTHGRAQAIGLKRFVDRNYKLVSTGQELP